jgi:hypothetical protein
MKVGRPTRYDCSGSVAFDRKIALRINGVQRAARLHGIDGEHAAFDL